MVTPLFIELSAYSVGFAVLAVLAVGALVVLLRRPRLPPAEPADAPRTSLLTARGDSLAAAIAAPEVDRTAYLSRFVVNAKGDRVGETVGFYEDQVVLKEAGAFFLVPATEVLDKDGNLVATADIDWDAAKARGEEWRTHVKDEMRYDESGMPVMNEKG